MGRYKLAGSMLAGRALCLLMGFATEICYLRGQQVLSFGYRADLCVLEIVIFVLNCSSAKL